MLIEILDWHIDARPRLCQNAVPSNLPGCPSYLSSEKLHRHTRFSCETKDEENFERAIR